MQEGPKDSPFDGETTERMLLAIRRASIIRYVGVAIIGLLGAFGRSKVGGYTVGGEILFFVGATFGTFVGVLSMFIFQLKLMLKREEYEDVMETMRRNAKPKHSWLDDDDAPPPADPD